MTDPYAIFAGSLLAVAVLAAWGFGEAVVLPVVPDVLLGILVLSAPTHAPVLFGAAVVGGVAGGMTLWALLRHRPSMARRLIELQPALGQPGLTEARDRLGRYGALVGMAQVGPGLPLKAYLAALADVAPHDGYRAVATYALVNRLARIGPPTLAFVLAAPLATGATLEPAAFGALYMAVWAVFYVAYWIWRDPRRRAS